jgi:hypothetical protein
MDRVVTADEYDPLSPEVQADPYPFYRLFQSGCPVHHHRLTEEQQHRVSPDGNPLIAAPTSEVFMVFGHDEIRTVLADHQTFSSLRGGVGLERTSAPNEVGMLIYADPPHHGPQRAIVAKALSPRLVKHMESRIAEYADRLIDGFVADGAADIVARYCNPLPGLMFCELLGLPGSDRPLFKKWADATVDAFGADAETQNAAAAAMFEMMQYFFALLAERRARLAAGRELPEDLTTGLMLTEVEGRCFNDFEIVLAVQLLIAGGNDTTSGALGSGLNQLCRHPDQQQLLRERPELLAGAVEEILRFDAPAHCLFRTTTRDVRLAGVAIPAGAKVGVPYGAANRDPKAFHRPDEFNIGRPGPEVRRHLSFGLGAHYCVGSALGRAQVRIGLERLMARLGPFRLDPDRPATRHDALIARRFGHLYLRWTPEAS